MPGVRVLPGAQEARVIWAFSFLQAEVDLVSRDLSKHYQFMDYALQEAQKAIKLGEIPIGAIVVDETGNVVASGYNLRETAADPTAHAEILALRAAGKVLGDWRLEKCSLYVTLEPCPMCAGAIVNARIKNLIFGAYDPKAGAAGTLMDVTSHPKLNHRVNVTGGVRAEECAALLRLFFGKLRSGMIP